MSYSGTKRSYGSSLKSYGGRTRRTKYTSRVGRPMIGRNSGPGRSGFKANFFRLQRAYKNEMGYVDLALASYPLDTTGSVTLLNTVPQGAAVTQRVGKKIVMKGLQCRGYLQNNSTAIANDVAFLIVYDKRPTGALPTVTDILVSANAAAMNNDANAGRFSILKRGDFVLLGNTNAAANYLDTMYMSNDFWLDLKSRPVTFKAAGTGAIGDIEEGALYLVTVGNTAAGTAAAAMAAGFRLRFIDV